MTQEIFYMLGGNMRLNWLIHEDNIPKEELEKFESKDLMRLYNIMTDRDHREYIRTILHFRGYPESAYSK